MDYSEGAALEREHQMGQTATMAETLLKSELFVTSRSLRCTGGKTAGATKGANAEIGVSMSNRAQRPPNGLCAEGRCLTAHNGDKTACALKDARRSSH